MLDRERRTAEAVDRLPFEVRGLLLEAIMAPPSERARLIGELHNGRADAG